MFQRDVDGNFLPFFSVWGYFWSYLLERVDPPLQFFGILFLKNVKFDICSVRTINTDPSLNNIHSLKICDWQKAVFIFWFYIFGFMCCDFNVVFICIYVAISLLLIFS